MKVLICGASGFIGRNLFEALTLNPRLDVYGTYWKNKFSQSNKLVQVNLTDAESARTVTRNMDVVINCAAITDGSGAVASNPAGYVMDNIRINSNLIEAAFINKIRHFIFLSCSVMYPSSNQPLKEDEHDLNNIHPKYFMGARMKVFSEDLCRFYASLGMTKYTAIRHTNIYGPYDKFDLIRGHVLSATIVKVMEAESQITIWGQGTESRDFLYVLDLIRFITKVFNKQENNFEIFNVGYGKTCTINELAEKIIFCSGKKLDILHDVTKPTIGTQMNIDVQKAKQIVGWKADIGLSEGLVMTLDWYRNQPR
jgi:GDP-L-fucose synthase